MKTDLLSQVAQKVRPGERFQSARKLTGGVSSWVAALELEESTLVFRQHSEAARAVNPHISRDEYRLLTLLHAQGVPVPVPLLLDESGEIFAEPYLVTEFVEGETGASPVNLTEMARVLAKIHEASGDFSFLREQEAFYSRLLPGLPEEVWASLELSPSFARAWPPPPINVRTLLHGDYWVGNILGRNGALVGVIDWEDAVTGDPLSDLATSRLELLWAMGEAACEEFTSRYLQVRKIDLSNLPQWDVAMALRATNNIGSWNLDAAVEAAMREKTKAFAARALAEV